MNSNTNFKRGLVYFEKQSNDRLCGLHCINSLLQGPYFDPVVLSEIGLTLDHMENQLLTHKHSGVNVDDDGNFGIQVLTEALKTLGVEVKALKKREAISIADQVEAFIFNSSSHWFSIRKIEGIWFNLNSTNSLPGPEIISDFYLSAFIQGAEDIGYTNFLVTKLPKLPNINSPLYSILQPHQKLVKYEDIIKVKNKKNNKKKKEEPFKGKGVRIDETAVLKESMDMFNQFQDDEMNQALEISLLEYAEKIAQNLPPEPKGIGYSITIKYENKSFTRKWSGDNTIGNLMDYTKSQIPTISSIELFEIFPKVVYNEPNKTIKQIGLSYNQILYAKLI